MRFFVSNRRHAPNLPPEIRDISIGLCGKHTRSHGKCTYVLRNAANGFSALSEAFAVLPRTACKTVLDTMQDSPGQRARLPRKKCGTSRSKVRNFRPETSEHSDGKCGTSPHAFRTARFHLAELPVPAGGKPGRDACTHAPKHQENSICSARTNRN